MLHPSSVASGRVDLYHSCPAGGESRRRDWLSSCWLACLSISKVVVSSWRNDRGNLDNQVFVGLRTELDGWRFAKNDRGNRKRAWRGGGGLPRTATWRYRVHPTCATFQCHREPVSGRAADSLLRLHSRHPPLPSHRQGLVLLNGIIAISFLRMRNYLALLSPLSALDLPDRPTSRSASQAVQHCVMRVMESQTSISLQHPTQSASFASSTSEHEEVQTILQMRLTHRDHLRMRWLLPRSSTHGTALVPCPRNPFRCQPRLSSPHLLVPVRPHQRNGNVGETMDVACTCIPPP